jgi:hypothetical protein
MKISNISKIHQTHKTILQKLEELHEIQYQTHSRYKECVEKNKINKVFGLDSFNYQSRLFDLEIKLLKEHYAFVNNRIYCDYYKLYGMVKTFYKENFKLEPKKRNYAPYKDLESFKLFEFTDSMNINQDILDMIQKSFDIIHKKEEEVIDIHTSHRMNIDNYIYNHRYNNDALKTKVELYEKYLHSYHIYHMSFLSNLLDKLRLLFRQNTNTGIEQFDNFSVHSETVNEIISSNPRDEVQIVIQDKMKSPIVPLVPLVPLVPVAPVPADPVPVEVPVVAPVLADPVPVEVPVVAPVLADPVVAPVLADPVVDSVPLVESIVDPIPLVESVESVPLDPVPVDPVPVESVDLDPAPVESIPSVPIHENTKKKKKKSKKASI